MIGKEMEEKKFKTKFEGFMKIFGNLLDKYEEKNPEWIQITLCEFLYSSVEQLKILIEDEKEKSITWESPAVELRYPVKANWRKLEPYYFNVTDRDFESDERTAGLLSEGFLATRNLFVLRALTKKILIVLKKDKAFYKVPIDIDKRLEKFSTKERQKRLEKILNSIIEPGKIVINADVDEPKRIKTKINLLWGINPCIINVDERRAYYPITIYLEFKGNKPTAWPDDIKKQFWETLLKEIKNATPEESLDFIEKLEKEPLPEPTVKPIVTALPVKVGMHTELQKFGHRPTPYQLSLFDRLLSKSVDIKEEKIDVIGLDLSQAQNQALFAIQKLLDRTNYKGNIMGDNATIEGFKFDDYLPALEFSPAQYLEAYGVRKYTTARGKEEFSGEERRQALEALAQLDEKLFIFAYERKYWIKTSRGRKEERSDLIETKDRLIKIIRGWEALTKKEVDSLKEGRSTQATDKKLKAIAIRPAPILVQDIHKYFTLKPANYYQEIRLLYPRVSKFVYRFIDWIIAQAELKRRKRQPLVIEENYEEIAYHLRMETYIENRHFKRIRQVLNKCYKTAKELGYLLSYQTIRGQTKELERLELNPEKFERIRGDNEERGRLGEGEIVH